MFQLVECFLMIHKVLGSCPSTSQTDVIMHACNICLQEAETGRSDIQPSSAVCEWEPAWYTLAPISKQ